MKASLKRAARAPRERLLARRDRRRARSRCALIAGVGFVNYDTLYALVWGGQLARGEAPAYGVPIAPTPHPLLELLG